ncbi:MAG: DNA polymerase Y family protein [Thermomicrobiales bacterium]|nr:DNA polymerase Y family protein [Thermomicrobiales bacterium]
MAIAAIVIPHFALRVALLEQPHLDGYPLILGPAPGARPAVQDLTPEAVRSGVRAGQGLREALALCPEARIITPHPVREQAAAERVIAGLEQLVPEVGVAPEPGRYLIDLTGLERRLGAPPQAARQLLRTMPAILRPRAGVADGRFPAIVAAYHAPPGGVEVMDSTRQTEIFAQTPIRLLPLETSQLRSLERLGVRTLGAFAALSPSAVAARFGRTGHDAWQLAHGEDAEPVRGRERPEVITARLALPSPVTTREMLQVAITRLVSHAFAQPGLQRHHVRQVRLQVILEDGHSWEHVATLRNPGQAQRVSDVLRYRLQDLALPGPVETLTLELSGLTDAASRQEQLPGFTSQRRTHLAEACQDLAQRFGGTSGLFQAVEVEPWSHLPERQHALITFTP